VPPAEGPKDIVRVTTAGAETNGNNPDKGNKDEYYNFKISLRPAALRAGIRFMPSFGGSPFILKGRPKARIYLMMD